MSEGAIEEPLLGEASDSGGEGCSGGGNLRDSFGSREIAESTRTDFTRRCVISTTDFFFPSGSLTRSRVQGYSQCLRVRCRIIVLLLPLSLSPEGSGELCQTPATVTGVKCEWPTGHEKIPTVLYRILLTPELWFD